MPLCPMDNRIGSFGIYHHTIKDNPEAALAILRGCLVLRAEMMAHTQELVYIAINEAFEPISLEEQVPFYCATVTMENIEDPSTYGVIWEKTKKREP
jgi:hypothetical protein